MKKVNIYILTLFLPWFLLACDDYLKEDSDDLLIPSLVIMFRYYWERGIRISLRPRSNGFI